MCKIKSMAYDDLNGPLTLKHTWIYDLRVWPNGFERDHCCIADVLEFEYHECTWF